MKKLKIYKKFPELKKSAALTKMPLFECIVQCLFIFYIKIFFKTFIFYINTIKVKEQ